MKKFEVSKYLVKKARSLKKELGIFAKRKAKTGKVLPQETVTTVLILRYRKKRFFIILFFLCHLSLTFAYFCISEINYIDQSRATMIRIKFAKFYFFSTLPV